jgi:hypothetical protein
VTAAGRSVAFRKHNADGSLDESPIGSNGLLQSHFLMVCYELEGGRFCRTDNLEPFDPGSLWREDAGVRV